MDGVLNRKFQGTNVVGVLWQFVLPHKIKNKVLSLAHDNLTSCHAGIERTLGKLKSVVYWFGYKRDVEDWTRDCRACNVRKPSPYRKHSLLRKMSAGYPLESIGNDISGAWPRTEKGNMWILVVGCHFIKFLEAYPIDLMSAKCVADVLVRQFFDRYGIPRGILNDQGSNFMSQRFSEIAICCAYRV